ncbi:transposase [Prosthecochloris sp. HL-130-GSB]|uniref:transposase n=1 Tax=Prosthecochloris sp. HL-130-GSB TaxID=1974213 RepID=UPI0035111331
MMNRHKENMLHFFRHRTTNAVTEGLNSMIQLIKASAQGFHGFEKLSNQNPVVLRQAQYSNLIMK